MQDGEIIDYYLNFKDLLACICKNFAKTAGALEGASASAYI